MERTFLHEALYRGEKRLEQFAAHRVIICGAGALGGNLCWNLARHGFKVLTVIDRDRVDSHNVSTQPYGLRDIGAEKARALANRLFRDLGVSVVAEAVELTMRNIGKLLGRNDLVVDTFDNYEARMLVTEYCAQKKIDCVHAGMSTDGYSEIVWNERYRVPKNIAGDICEYPLARNLIDFTVTLASEAIIAFVADGVKENFSFTLKDKKVHRF